MRMTKQMKESFVESVMADVPKTDYAEQIRAVILNAAVEALPPAVRKVWDDTALRGYVKNAYFADYSLCSGIGVQVPSADNYDPTVPLTKQQREDITALREKHDAQCELQQDLRNKLRHTVASITTTQQLVKLLPEFKDYVPAEVQTDRSVPAVANLLKDLVEAGWPDGKKPATETA